MNALCYISMQSTIQKYRQSPKHKQCIGDRRCPVGLHDSQHRDVYRVISKYGIRYFYGWSHTWCVVAVIQLNTTVEAFLFA